MHTFQQLHGFDVLRFDCEVDWVFLLDIEEILPGLVLQQIFDHLDLALFGCVVERGVAEAINRVDLDPFL